MRGFVAVLSAALCVAPCAVQAASLDCAAAKSLRERAICADPELQRWDAQVERDFTTTSAKASPAFRPRLQAERAAWQAAIETMCTTGQTDPRNAVLRRCLKTEMITLGNVLLSGVETKGPFRFISETRITIQPDPARIAAQGETYARLSKMWATIETPASPLTDAFNAWVMEQFRPGELAITDPGIDSFQSFTPLYATAHYVVMLRSSLSVRHGTDIHDGVMSDAYFTWLVDQQRPLAAEDLFAGPNWPLALARLAAAAFKHDNQARRLTVSDSEMAKLVADPARWNISKPQLSLSFNAGELAPKEDESQTVDIRWDQLGPILNRNSPIPALLRQ